MPNDTHALTRTSPKGVPFIGTCLKCGATNLPVSAVREPCLNPANLTDEHVLEVVVCQENPDA